MTKRTRLLIGTGLAALIGATAIAGVSYAGRSHDRDVHGGHHYGKHGGFARGEVRRNMLKIVDANGDDKITQEEVDKAIADRMAKYDANKDGKLSLGEFDGLWNEIMQPARVRAFQHLDPNGDAQIAKSELDDRFGKMVKRLDRDGDGALSREDRHHRHHWRHHDRQDDDRGEKTEKKN